MTVPGANTRNVLPFAIAPKEVCQERSGIDIDVSVLITMLVRTPVQLPLVISRKYVLSVSVTDHTIAPLFASEATPLTLVTVMLLAEITDAIAKEPLLPALAAPLRVILLPIKLAVMPVNPVNVRVELTKVVMLAADPLKPNASPGDVPTA
jgi:hypothetical protein